jgi:hypothetical protein
MIRGSYGLCNDERGGQEAMYVIDTKDRLLEY